MTANITLKLDPDLIREARALAAAEGRSVSVLVADRLESLVRERKDRMVLGDSLLVMTSLRRALRAEIDEAAWSSLYSTTSRPFAPSESGRIAVKVINHHGDEVLKVFEV